MTWVAVAVAGGSIVGGMISAGGARDAAGMQAAASQYAADKQKEMFDIQNKQNAPGRGAGYQSYNLIRSMLPGQYTQYDEQGNPIAGTATGQDYLTHQFNAQDFANNIDPGYAFRLQQGQAANQAMANKAGGLLGGNALAGLQDYTQGSASQEFGNAFNRYQTQRSNIYNTLASIAGLGQTAQQQQNQLAQNYANAQTGLITGGAAAQAAGTVGAANALGGAVGNVGNALAFNQMMKNQPVAQTTGLNRGYDFSSNMQNYGM